MKLPVHRFAEVEDGPNRVAVTWRANAIGTATHVEATFDGTRLVADPRRTGDSAPWTFRLADGRLLTVQIVVTHFFLLIPDVRIDGRPLPLSAFDRDRYLRRSGQILGSLATGHLVIAALWGLIARGNQGPVQGSVTNLTVGVGIMAAAVKMQRSPRPAAVAVLLCVACSSAAGLLFASTGLWCVTTSDLLAVPVAIDVLRRFREPAP